MTECASDRMAGVPAQVDGPDPTDRPEDADVILFNTGAEREKTQERVFRDLGRVHALKAACPGLVIGGGAASQQGGAIVTRAPRADVGFDPQAPIRLPSPIEHVVEMPGMGRTRDTTSHPKEMTPRPIDACGAVVKLASQLPLPVLPGPDRALTARTGNRRVVNFAGDPALAGTHVDLVVTTARAHSLRGELAG